MTSPTHGSPIPPTFDPNCEDCCDPVTWCHRHNGPPPVGGATREPTKSQVRYNAEQDPTYRPYCMRCSGLVRMQIVEPFYWRCACGAEHDERRSPVEAGAPEEHATGAPSDEADALTSAIIDGDLPYGPEDTEWYESRIATLTARVSQLEATVAETGQALDTLADAVGDYLTAWDAKDAADCAREELCDTNLEDVQRLGRAKARALSALRSAHRAAPERPERASSLTSERSERLRGPSPQVLAVEALTAARLSAEQERDALREEVQMQNHSGTTAKGQKQEPEPKGESSIRVGQKWRDTRLQGHQTVRVSAYTAGAKVVTVYSDRWWGTGLRQLRVTTLRKHFRPVA